ncbi:ABC transporter permease [Noviherbaspirillum sp. Root189]|uniref:ABC transporter permease n=1 Tax=Noviherbaspirillum sp. Root189 TaxID=1736487 RepID=UPI00070BF3DE|nr:ABC transporter permease [Noviherbaspirillum sp. Root189]KRB93549.1 ABC transporter permease [Noviherbaspirillum sp. Root189]
MNRERLGWMTGSLLVAAGFAVLWHAVCAMQWVSPVYLPSPGAVAAALADGFRQGNLAELALGTIAHMVYGWLLATLLGIVLGTLIGVSPSARAWLQPTLEYIRPLPASAVVPVAIALFGLSPAMVLGVIAFGAVWPVLLASIHGFAVIEPRLIETARMLRMSRLAFIWKIGLPNALPDILSGARLSLTVALVLSVVGEMLASQEGLGMAILVASRGYQSADLFAGVVLLSLIGYVSDTALKNAERRFLRWRLRQD